jgi:hypothetical protein
MVSDLRTGSIVKSDVVIADSGIPRPLMALMMRVVRDAFCWRAEDAVVSSVSTPSLTSSWSGGTITSAVPDVVSNLCCVFCTTSVCANAEQPDRIIKYAHARKIVT